MYCVYKGNHLLEAFPSYRAAVAFAQKHGTRCRVVWRSGQE
jgi:hypothetical protein